MTKRIKISLNANGEGTLECVGLDTFPCLGNPSMVYPPDITNTGEVGREKFEERFSSEFQVTMKWAILLGWERGLFIHEGADNIADNGGVSAGCVHLAAPNAKTVYDWVDGRTRITTTVAGRELSADSANLSKTEQKLSRWTRFWQTVVGVDGSDIAAVLPILITVSIFAMLYFRGLGGDVSDVTFARGWISQVFASGTIAIAMALVVSTLFPTREGDGSKERFERGREVLTVLVGIFGTILGFYFGSIQTEGSSPIIYSVSPDTIDEAGATVQVMGLHLASADAFLVGDTTIKGTSTDSGQISLKVPTAQLKGKEHISVRAIESSSGRISNPFFVKVKKTETAGN